MGFERPSFSLLDLILGEKDFLFSFTTLASGESDLILYPIERTLFRMV